MALVALVAESVLKDFKNCPDIMSDISDVQLGANTMARRVSALSANVMGQLEKDLSICSFFSIQCDESVDASDTAQLALFARMVFEDFTNKEEFLTLLPLKSTTSGVDIYNEVKNYFVKTKIPLNKLVAITTDGAPAMTGRHSGFVACCKADPDFPPLLHYHCIIHHQAICAKVMGFDHVMAPVVRIINSICAKAKQHRMFKIFLEELSAAHSNLLLHTEIRWLSRGKILRRFLSLLPEIKDFMRSRNEDISQLCSISWLLDLAFLADVTERLNTLNCELQGKGKTIADMISSVKTFKSNLFTEQVVKRKMHHFPSVMQMLTEHTASPELLNIDKYSSLLSRLKEEFSDRFRDFERIEPCVMFIANPFIEVNVCERTEQMGELFNLNSCAMEMEIVSLQGDILLKSRQSHTNFWSLVDHKEHSNICTAALKVTSLFGSTYLCESAFSDMNFIKSKFRTRLTDEHLSDSIQVAVSSYTPDYRALVDGMQCQPSQ
ncbi:general transcription factor II-I repeat domain-containing protein 2-like [Ambystoma mexicanum]|uniref:general transcription factor II-I repeat domain-containing protein 2-like n=1 Tax=Ambystoma mexicanum TaxID=8296 RepID=UPI0037E967E0